MFHGFKIEGSEEIGTTQGTSRMTAGSAMHHSYDIPANLGGNCF